MTEIKNVFLRSFTPEQRAMLEPLQHIQLRRGDHVYLQGEPATHLIFLDSGFVSTLRTTPDGIATEVWSWGGPTGLIGTHTMLQAPECLFTFLTRIEGEGWAIGREAMHNAMAADPTLAVYVQRIVRNMSEDLARMLACEKAHSAEQRFARLLVMLRDGIGDYRIPLSRITLGEMLGVSRKHGYLLAEKLARRAAVTFDTDSLTIHRVRALERLACPCLRGIYQARRRVAVASS